MLSSKKEVLCICFAKKKYVYTSSFPQDVIGGFPVDRIPQSVVQTMTDKYMDNVCNVVKQTNFLTRFSQLPNSRNPNINFIKKLEIIYQLSSCLDQATLWYSVHRKPIHIGRYFKMSSHYPLGQSSVVNNLVTGWDQCETCLAKLPTHNIEKPFSKSMIIYINTLQVPYRISVKRKNKQGTRDHTASLLKKNEIYIIMKPIPSLVEGSTPGTKGQHIQYLLLLWKGVHWTDWLSHLYKDFWTHWVYQTGTPTISSSHTFHRDET